MSDRSVRQPPPSPHAGVGSGRCRWCGDEVAPGRNKRKRGWHDGRDGEPNCLGIYFIATRSCDQRDACLERDGGRCAGCGVCCYSPSPGATYSGGEELEFAMRVRRDVEGPFSVVSWVKTRPWIADHVTPLWSVARAKPWAELIWFWSIENLQTLCQDCSDRKTASEATQRAKEKRIRWAVAGLCE